MIGMQGVEEQAEAQPLLHEIRHRLVRRAQNTAEIVSEPIDPSNHEDTAADLAHEKYFGFGYRMIAVPIMKPVKAGNSNDSYDQNTVQVDCILARASIIDLDVKKLDKIPKYRELDEQIVNHWLTSMRGSSTTDL